MAEYISTLFPGGFGWLKTLIMSYSIEKVTTLIGARRYGAAYGNISWLLTDSRSVCFPEETLFFAVRSERNDGHVADRGKSIGHRRDGLDKSRIICFHERSKNSIPLNKFALESLNQISIHFTKSINASTPV